MPEDCKHTLFQFSLVISYQRYLGLQARHISLLRHVLLQLHDPAWLDWSGRELATWAKPWPTQHEPTIEIRCARCQSASLRLWRHVAWAAWAGLCDAVLLTLERGGG
jgi:hypothetical protein